MILAIVGSTCLEGDERAEVLISEVFDAHPECTGFVSGGAVGIDTMAQREAERRGIPCDIKLPAAPNWGQGYRPRNILIAKTCDKLVRIVSARSKTYGSGWTRDYAAKLGKPTEEYKLS